MGRKKREAEQQELTTVQELDAVLERTEKAISGTVCHVNRTDLEALLRELWLMRGKTEPEAEIIAVLGAQNLDRKADPKKDSTLKIETVLRRVEAGKVLDFHITTVEADHSLGFASHVGEDRPVAPLIGAVSLGLHSLQMAVVTGAFS